MKNTILLYTIALILSFSCFTTNKAEAQTRLTISPEMVTNLSARGDEWLLFDYQELTGSQPCQIPQATFPWVYFDASWNGKSFFYPVEVLVDLGYNQNITQICLRDASNQGGLVTVYGGGPENWNQLYQHNANSSECRTISSNSRYLKFHFNSTAARIREIELYGNQSNIITCPPSTLGCSVLNNCSCADFTMDEFIGINTNNDVPPAMAHPFGFIRNYQTHYFNIGYDDPSYVGYPDGTYAFSPTNAPLYDNDYFYKAMKDVGVEINATMHHAPPNLVTFAYLNNDFDYNIMYPFSTDVVDISKYHKITERKPISEEIYGIGIDSRYEEPVMYLEYAEFYYQFGARYGSPGNSVGLKVAPDNTPKSGLDLIDYVENWNEPDKWWQYSLVNGISFLDPWVEEQMGYFNPFEFAAMSSASFDGDGLQNGTQKIINDRYPNGAPANAGPVGLDAANSNMKYVMGGLTEINLDYIKAVKFWFETYRPDIGFPFDVINFHDYFNDAPENVTLGQNALSPEEYGIREKVREAVEFRDQYLPGVEVWLSEFGYDSHPASIQSASCQQYCGGDCYSNACYDKFREIQAQWVTRSFLEIAAGGADRAMVFTMRDGGPADQSYLYNTSGLCYWFGPDETGYEPKEGWYYVATMSKALEGLTYDSDYVHNDPNVRVYRFVDNCNNPQKTVYAVWSPTSIYGDDTPVVSNYALPMLGNSATLIHLENGDVDGVRTQLSPNCNGNICVNVSERPKFIVVGNDDSEDLAGCDCNNINYNVSGNGNVSNLRNERNNLGDLYCGFGNQMTSAWTPNAGNEAIVDLGGSYNLNSLYFHYDGTAIGDVEIYFGSPGNWQLFENWNTYNPSPTHWKNYFFDEGHITTHIRIRVLNNNLVIHEMAVCGQALQTNNPTCNDGIQNQGETGVDCGGPCAPCQTISCFDGIQNGNESGIDCGGNCPPCPSCNDGVQNQGETGVDCGGPCAPCQVISCNDGLQNGNETGIDCGGNCPPCNTGSCQIVLTPNMFFDIYGQSAAMPGFAGDLANEQNAMGDPINGTGAEVFSSWEYPWFAGVEAYIDLGQEYDINSIHLFDGYGSGYFKITPGLPGSNNAPVINHDMNLWPPNWRSFNNINTTTRYLTLERVDPEAKVNEIAICGTPANSNPSCSDGIQNQGETGIDCGGPCSPCQTASCNDGIQSGNETGVDCGGNCPPCASCNDGIQNQGETGVDCGGPCSPCQTVSCNDGIQNGNETGVDCGGNCPPCNTGSCQIPLNPSMFYNIYGQSESGESFSGSLADEQSSMGDPINGNGLEVTDPWQFPWADGVQAYVDLGQEYVINGVYLYDGYGSGFFEVAPGLPVDNGTPVVNSNMNAWPPTWRNFEGLQFTARYLTFTRVAGEAKINEIALCGYPVGNRSELVNQNLNVDESCTPQLFPNPTEDLLNINTINKPIKRLMIVDTNGAIMMEMNNIDAADAPLKLNVSELMNGMYFLHIEHANGCGSVFKRFVKMDRK